MISNQEFFPALQVARKAVGSRAAHHYQIAILNVRPRCGPGVFHLQRGLHLVEPLDQQYDGLHLASGDEVEGRNSALERIGEPSPHLSFGFREIVSMEIPEKISLRVTKAQQLCKEQEVRA